MPDGAFSWLGQWVRHNIVSVLATAVDFATMIGLVELLHFSPVLATVAGAAAGGVTSFTLGRHFTYRSQTDPVSGQMLRYGLVSGASLGLNALGEHLILFLLASHYVVGRILVATTVNNAWNYPMQKMFVFVPRKSAKENPA